MSIEASNDAVTGKRPVQAMQIFREMKECACGTALERPAWRFCQDEGDRETISAIGVTP